MMYGDLFGACSSDETREQLSVSSGTVCTKNWPELAIVNVFCIYAVGNVCLASFCEDCAHSFFL